MRLSGHSSRTLPLGPSLDAVADGGVVARLVLLRRRLALVLGLCCTRRSAGRVTVERLLHLRKRSLRRVSLVLLLGAAAGVSADVVAGAAPSTAAVWTGADLGA